MKEKERDEENIKRCPICGCTEHRIFGCGKHWANHKAHKDGRCEMR